MMDKKTWVDLIIGGVEMFSNPSREFDKYEYGTLISFYNNYLEYASIFLSDDCFLEDIEQYQELFEVPDSLLKKLITLRGLIDNFYDSCKDLDDFTLIRRKEWDEIIPVAKECAEGLQKMLKEESS